MVPRKFGEKVETRAKKRNDRVGGGERRKQRFLFSPPLFPSILFFWSCSNFCTITQLETLATQAMLPKMEPSCIIGHVLYIGEWQKRGGLGTTLWPKQSILLPRLCRPKSFQDQPLLSRTSQRVIDIFIFSSQEDLFAKSTFFPASIFTQKCGTDPVFITITLRKYSPGKKTPLEKDKVSILCMHLFFCDSYLLLLPPTAFLALPCKKHCIQEQTFHFFNSDFKTCVKK